MSRQVGANSGQVRAEQRETPSGIGRPQLQRWKTRRRGGSSVALSSGLTRVRPPALGDPFNHPLKLGR